MGTAHCACFDGATGGRWPRTPGPGTAPSRPASTWRRRGQSSWCTAPVRACTPRPCPNSPPCLGEVVATTLREMATSNPSRGMAQRFNRLGQRRWHQPAVCSQAAVRNNGGLIKEAKAIIRLFPIWAACLLYAVAYSQSSTFFTKQAATLDRRIGRHVQVPPAALQSFISVTIVVIIPIYDRVLVPVSRRYSGKPSGITMLQRIGTGMFLSLLSMVIAALVENRSCDLEAATWRLHPSYGRAIRCYLVDLRSIQARKWRWC
ncbi:hypothetical protein ZEAMMB73_Zm00001d053030, partial [Zea mays]